MYAIAFNDSLVDINFLASSYFILNLKGNFIMIKIWWDKLSEINHSKKSRRGNTFDFITRLRREKKRKNLKNLRKNVALKSRVWALMTHHKLLLSHVHFSHDKNFLSLSSPRIYFSFTHSFSLHTISLLQPI